ncbi:hypothetical protein B9Z19DRAFT_510468 [Tuber borchii]|uniref:Uncharacterized protein n=1 Tax=Tuber borchii TaxID=42251 RepID=A0A2T6ZE72_TUBBO|nr:hypothetical protein B9Z19DRAFT_510468 [Tuber borchii]
MASKRASNLGLLPLSRSLSRSPPQVQCFDRRVPFIVPLPHAPKFLFPNNKYHSKRQTEQETERTKSQINMASRSTHHRSKSADVRRTLFRSLSRSTANTGMDNTSTTSSSVSSGLGGGGGGGGGSGGGGGEEDDSVGNVSGSESIIVRKSDGTFDIEAPPVVGMHEHLGLQEIERECRGILFFSFSFSFRGGMIEC